MSGDCWSYALWALALGLAIGSFGGMAALILIQANGRDEPHEP